MKLNKIYIYMLLAASVYAQAKDQDMSGFQIGAGVNIVFDKNEFFDVQVANQVKAVSAQAEKGVSTAAEVGDLVTKLWAYNETKVATEDIKVGEAAVITKGKNITVSLTQEGTNTVYYTASKNAKIVKKAVGGELKLAYFHDFNNGIMVGIDTSCVFSPKNKKSVKPGYMNPHPDLALTTTSTTNTYEPFTWDGKEGYTTQKTCSISNGDDVSIYPINLDGFTEDTIGNPGTEVEKLLSYVSFDEKHDKYGEITVENRICSPRAALVVGIASDGIFAGIRGGVLHEKLKVSANGYWYTGANIGSTSMPDHQETKSRVMSITAPFVGLHFIKQVHVGSNDAQLYFTADRRIGNDEKDVNIYCVKKLKRNRYSISAGITWMVKR